MRRIIGHLDMDAFFAAIEERDNPRFKGKPIVVGADPMDGRGRGVVSTANYKAREYGIHSAMPISRAWQLTEAAKRAGKPETIFLGGNHKKYEAVSERIMKIVRSRVPLVEETSIDEAYLDLSFTGSFEKAKTLAAQLKKEISQKEKLTASAGIGPNKLIAKIASGIQKPDGLTVIQEKDAEKFLEPLSIRKIPGIGPKTELLFKKLRIETVGDLKKLSLKEMEKLLGKWGQDLYRKSRGIDDSPVTEEYEIKSIGEQETFAKDTLDTNLISERLKEMTKRVFQRFKQSIFKKFKTITVTVRFADFETKSRSHTLAKPTSDFKTFRFEALRLLLPFFDKRENPKKKLIRLIGVRMEKLAGDNPRT